MQNTNNNVELINLSQIYESLRYSEYSVANGIGELADNGVEAGAHNIRVDVISSKKKVPGKKKDQDTVDAICVADDGSGMDKETLWKALKLGESMRTSINGKRGIGRFGVGMTLGSISIGRKVEVFSRQNASEDFFYTYIDLDEISMPGEEGMKRIPEPKHKNIPVDYNNFYEGKTGTLVMISSCDRVREDASDVNASIANYLGRTYRKFIEGGMNVVFNGNKVYLHDPLYLSGPTQFDTKNGTDPKATLYDSATIKLEVPGTDGEEAEIKITLSLLPIEWRQTRGNGASVENKKRKVDQNEGVSILRANREVFYDKVPYLIGSKGQAKYEEKDRFWGCEISFPPELDDYFQVRYIKRGAEPVSSLKDKLRKVISDAIKELRKTISADWAKNELIEGRKGGDYGNVERTAEKAENSRIMKGTSCGRTLTPEEEDKIIDDIVNSTTTEKTDAEERKKEKEERKEQIKRKPVTLAPVSYPASILFEPKYLMNGRMVININVNHPFYQKFIVPLCGNLNDENAELTAEKQHMRDAIFLLFCSYARATAVNDDEKAQSLYESHLSDMGTFLSVLTKEYSGEFKIENEK